MREKNLTLIGASSAIFWPGSFVFGLPGVMAPYWIEKLGISKSELGNILFFLLISLGIFMFLVGKWQKKLGFSKIIALGILLNAFSLFYLYWVNSPLGLFSWAFLIGTASCFVYIPGLTVVQRAFPERKGLVSGIVNMVFGLSAAIMAPIFRLLLQRWGYENMILLLLGLTLGFGLFASSLIKEPKETKLIQSLGGFSLRPKEALKTSSFWLIWTIWALQGAAGISLVMFLVPFGLSLGFQMKEAVFLLSSFNLANGVSRLISGFLSDMVGRRPVMGLSFLVSGFCYFLLPKGFSPLGTGLLCLGIGFAFGTLFSVSAPLVSDYFGLEHFGVIFGLIFTAYGFLAGLLGPSLSGYLLDLWGNYGYVFYYLGTFSMVASLLMVFLKKPKI
jgi:OFA family oxalate/formate antiporter-like MFS transporter